MRVRDLKVILERCDDDSEVRVAVPLNEDGVTISIPILEWSECEGQFTLSSEKMRYALPEVYVMKHLNPSERQ